MDSYSDFIPESDRYNFGQRNLNDYMQKTKEIKSNLINQFNNFIISNEINEEKQLYSKIFQYFFEAEKEMKTLKISDEEINKFLTEIFCDQPFINYVENFNNHIKDYSNKYMEKNILNNIKISFFDFLEQKIYHTKLPIFIKNLIKIFIIEKKTLKTDITKEESDKNFTYFEKQKDWDLNEIKNLLDSPEEKERLNIILKNIEKELKPKPLFFFKSEKRCEEEYKEILSSFNITSCNKYFFNSNNITICISGFLTQKLDHFSGWKLFFRENKEPSLFYFLNWPSKSGICAILTFNKVKKIANLFGKILANLIVSEKGFKNKNITLVGHSLGCHLIKCCIKELAENNNLKKHMNNKIEKIIFFGGATQIKNNNRWLNILNKVTEGNILNFYSENDKALITMETKLVWGKEAIGRRELKIQNLDIKNYDCSEFQFKDFFHHGYKEVYDKIAEFYDL